MTSILRKRTICALLAAAALIFSSCGETTDPVDEYADLIDAAEPTMTGRFGKTVTDIEELIDECEPELVATAQVVMRGEPSDSMTPYDMTLTEVFVGDLKKGDSITLLALYEAKDGKVISKANTGLKALRVGSEYLIFVSDIGFEKGEFAGTYGNVTRSPGYIKISGEFDSEVLDGKYPSAKELLKEVRRVTR